MNKKGADQTAQLRRLVCAFIVRKPPKTGFLASRPLLLHIHFLKLIYINQFAYQLQYYVSFDLSWSYKDMKWENQLLNYCLLLLLLYVPVNSFGHGGTVSSPNLTFSWANLNKRLTSTLCTYFRL